MVVVVVVVVVVVGSCKNKTARCRHTFTVYHFLRVPLQPNTSGGGSHGQMTNQGEEMVPDLNTVFSCWKMLEVHVCTGNETGATQKNAMCCA